MNPVLKYRGGKSREIPRFLQYIPDDFNRYIEPFFGGGAVFFYLEPDNAIINDANERLMTFYRQLRDNYPEMRVQLDELQRQYEANQADFKRLKALTPDERVPNANEELYYRMRKLFNNPDNTFLDGVLYFFSWLQIICSGKILRQSKCIQLYRFCNGNYNIRTNLWKE